MSAEVATLDKVRQAAETLRRKGVRPTADRIIELIGGSKSTVLEHLRALRSTAAEADELPISVIEMVRASLMDVYRAGRSAEAEKVRGATERLSQVVEEQDAQIEELMLDNERLTSSNEQSERKTRESSAAEAASTDRVRQLEAENADLKAQLAAARASASQELRDALSRVESIVRSAADLEKPTGAGRRTVRLPTKSEV